MFQSLKKSIWKSIPLLQKSSTKKIPLSVACMPRNKVYKKKTDKKFYSTLTSCGKSTTQMVSSSNPLPNKYATKPISDAATILS